MYTPIAVFPLLDTSAKLLILCRIKFARVQALRARCSEGADLSLIIDTADHALSTVGTVHDCRAADVGAETRE